MSIDINIIVTEIIDGGREKKPRCLPYRLNSPWTGMCTRRTAPC